LSGGHGSYSFRPKLEGIREIATIWSAELRRAVRSPRVIILLGLYGLFSALALFLVGWITSRVSAAAAEQLNAQSAPEGALDQAAANAKQALLSGLFDKDASLLEALSKLPLVIPVVFKITLFFLPAYVAFLGFDQLSGEIEPKSIRYLAIRARRSSILVGKFLAQATVVVGMILVIDAVIFAYARLISPDFAFGLLAPSLLRFWIAAAVFSVAYVALTTLCSALFALPAVSLIVNFFALFVFWVIQAVGSYLQDAAAMQAAAAGEEPSRPVLALVRFLSPSAYSTDLLHPEWARFGIGIGAYAAFSAAFLVLGWAILRARDV